jgi:hypothetical protein
MRYVCNLLRGPAPHLYSTAVSGVGGELGGDTRARTHILFCTNSAVFATAKNREINALNGQTISSEMMDIKSLHVVIKKSLH